MPPLLWGRGRWTRIFNTLYSYIIWLCLGATGSGKERAVGSDSRRSLTGRVVVVTGASRGIGRDIAVRVAADGARVALLAKTETPHPKIAGTLGETARAVEEAG